MRERPILFSAPMVQAILAGRKSQTRRVVKNPDWIACLTGDCPHDRQSECDALLASMSPYGVAGDRLYVRERTWFRSADGITAYADGSLRTHPTAMIGTKMFPAAEPPKDDWPNNYRQFGFRSVPSIHMPRWASRITLEVTAVRIQRLRDITPADADSEGMDRTSDDYLLHGPLWCFARLWDSINGKRPGCEWADNPWVWAITFRRLA